MMTAVRARNAILSVLATLSLTACPPEPSAALGLLLGQRDRALGVLVSEQPLGRRADLDEDVLMPETPTQPGNHGFRPQ